MVQNLVYEDKKPLKKGKRTNIIMEVGSKKVQTYAAAAAAAAADE